MAAAAAAVVLAGAARGGASQRQESEAVPRKKKGTPSRWRFHPPPPLAFRLGLAAFPVQPPEATSTYSRSVLGASATLQDHQSDARGSKDGSAQRAHKSFRRPISQLLCDYGRHGPSREIQLLVPPSGVPSGLSRTRNQRSRTTSCLNSLFAPSA